MDFDTTRKMIHKVLLGGVAFLSSMGLTRPNNSDAPLVMPQLTKASCVDLCICAHEIKKSRMLESCRRRRPIDGWKVKGLGEDLHIDDRICEHWKKITVLKKLQVSWEVNGLQLTCLTRERPTKQENRSVRHGLREKKAKHKYAKTT